MTRRHLTIFAEACRWMSFSQAAEALNTTQPAVSLAVKELEEHYGVRLFERMNRRVYLTEAGRTLLVTAQEVLRGFQQAEDRLNNGPYRLRVGANVTFGATRLAPLLRKFQALQPQTILEAVVENSDRIEKRLLENQLDAGVVDNVSVSPQLKTRPLYREDMALLCAPDFGPRPRTLEELAGLPLLLREEGSGLRRCVDRVFQDRGLSPRPLVESVSTAALVEAAQAGLGILILPEALAAPALREGRLETLTLPGVRFPRQYSLALHRQKVLSTPLKAFLALLEEQG